MPRYRYILIRACLLIAVALALVPTTALGAGDDYPAEYRNGDPATQFDRWGYIVRSNESFIAWRLEQHGIKVRYSEGWGIAIQTSVSFQDFQSMIVPAIGAKVDRTPAPESLALWPAQDGQLSHTEWVLGVNEDGSLKVEAFSTNAGYLVATTQAAPYYIHLPSGSQIPPSQRVPGTTPGGSRTPDAPRVGTVTVKGRVLTVRLNLRRSGTIRFTLQRAGRTIKGSKKVAAGLRTVRLRLSAPAAPGRYRLRVQAPADRAGAVLRLQRALIIR